MTVGENSFDATVRNEGDATIIDMRGEINAFAEQALNRAYEDAQRDQPTCIMLNFTDVDYINSTGIALIVGLLAQARMNHIKLVTFGLSDHYLEIFNITRLADFMTIVHDETLALAEAI
jgi:anti-anti-sigma factor